VTQPAGEAAGASRWAAGEDAAAHAFVDSLDDSVEIAGADGHHLQRVRRLRVGEHVTLADGAGNWRRYEIESSGSGRLAVGARSARFVEPEIIPRVALALALTKAGALDTVVTRCTELGVARVVPIRTRRCVVRWTAEQAEHAVGRLQHAAREAAAQSRRARVPIVSPVADLAFIAQQPGVVVADPNGEAVSALPLPARNEPPSEEWIVVVGPEGGLDPTELELLDRAPRVRLGPHILRAETAPIAATVLLLDRAREMCREW
jgi:16S rRNA (uracil1498-N3)-methyltransferase